MGNRLLTTVADEKNGWLSGIKSQPFLFVLLWFFLYSLILWIDSSKPFDVVGSLHAKLQCIGEERLVLGAGVLGHPADVVNLAHVPAAGTKDIH